MSDIGTTSALLAALVSAALSQSPAPETRPPVMNPYPRSIKHCSEHITGARQPDGNAGAHINWTGYYTMDPIEKVAEHYTRLLGADNHRKEDGEDVWRFPLDKPNSVLSVRPASRGMPGSQCKPLPKSARVVVIISSMSGRD
jgi:hypothetical protein